ncbi:MAG: sigma-70 family RNA polymerase sigma factor [Gemmataceae bacterium]|nr:sigma-70 family RNA polymerase sigma factor [Gemmataceae bacterium]
MSLPPSLLERLRPLLRLQARRLQLDRRLGRRFDPSDLAQETILRACERADQFRGTTEAEAVAWVQQIFRTVALNKVAEATAQARDYHREVPFDDLLAESSVWAAALLADPSPAPDDKAARVEVLARLAERVERLPPDQRDAVNLWRLQGLSVPAIAGLLDKTPKAVAGLIHRGLLALRAFADDEGLEPP